MLSNQPAVEQPAKSILVLDDEQSFCKVVAAILESQGYEVRQASRAIDALGIMDESQPDLILTDLMMPGGDGFSFIRQVRRQPIWADIPVVMVTAHDEPEVQATAMAVGAAGFMAKPFSASELRETVGAYFTEN